MYVNDFLAGPFRYIVPKACTDVMVQSMYVSIYLGHGNECPCRECCLTFSHPSRWVVSTTTIGCIS